MYALFSRALTRAFSLAHALLSGPRPVGGPWKYPRRCRPAHALVERGLVVIDLAEIVVAHRHGDSARAHRQPCAAPCPLLGGSGGHGGHAGVAST